MKGAQSVIGMKKAGGLSGKQKDLEAHEMATEAVLRGHRWKVTTIAVLVKNIVAVFF